MWTAYTALVLGVYAAVVATWSVGTIPINVFAGVEQLTPGSYTVAYSSDGAISQFWQNDASVFHRLVDQDGDTYVQTESAAGADEDVVTVGAQGTQILDVGRTDGVSIDYPHKLRLEDAQVNGVSLQAPPEQAGGEVTFVFPADPPTEGQVLQTLNAADNVTSTVNLTWADNSCGVGNFTELTYRNVPLPAVVYESLATATDQFAVETTSIEVEPPGWQSVTVEEDEAVRFDITIQWANDQNDAGSTRYGELDIERDSVRQTVYYHHVTHSVAGTEYALQTVMYYDFPGAGTYNYRFGLRAANADILVMMYGQAKLSVVYNPNREYDLYDWRDEI